MKANESYRRALVLLKMTLLRNIALTLTFISLDTSLTNQMRATEQYVPVVLFVIILCNASGSNLCCTKQKTVNTEFFIIIIDAPQSLTLQYST